jgi:hypothetical protein
MGEKLEMQYSNCASKVNVLRLLERNFLARLNFAMKIQVV